MSDIPLLRLLPARLPQSPGLMGLSAARALGDSGLVVELDSHRQSFEVSSEEGWRNFRCVAVRF